MIMKKGWRNWWFFCLMIPSFLLISCLVSSVTCTRLILTPPDQTLTPPFSPKQSGVEEEEEVSTSSRLGSRPPSCRYRCRGCVPCEAIQIPAKSYPIGVLYANYEPEGWKCKCGASFFNP